MNFKTIVARGTTHIFLELVKYPLSRCRLYEPDENNFQSPIFEIFSLSKKGKKKEEKKGKKKPTGTSNFQLFVIALLVAYASAGLYSGYGGYGYGGYGYGGYGLGHGIAVAPAYSSALAYHAPVATSYANTYKVRKK